MTVHDGKHRILATIGSNIIMQSMTSYRRRRYIVEKHKIPMRRHKRASNVRKFSLPCFHGRAVPLHIGAQMGRPLRQRPAAKNALRKSKRVFSSTPRRPLFGRRRRRSPWQGGRRRRKPSLPAGEKVLKRSLLEDFSLFFCRFYRPAGRFSSSGPPTALPTRCCWRHSGRAYCS